LVTWTKGTASSAPEAVLARAPVSPGAWRRVVTTPPAPKAAADRLKPAAADAQGRLRLSAAVTAPPENGKANAALIALLAKHLRCPKRAIQIASGETRREKTLIVSGDPAALEKRLAPLLKFAETA